MRILNREQFLAMPWGTLFAEYRPIIAGELMVKWDTTIPFDAATKNAGDYIYQCISLAIKHDDSGEFADKMLAAQKDAKTSLEMDFDYSSRRSDFDPDKFYIVYEAADLSGIMELLGRCLDTTMSNPTVTDTV